MSQAIINPCDSSNPDTYDLAACLESGFAGGDISGIGVTNTSNDSNVTYNVTPTTPQISTNPNAITPAWVTEFNSGNPNWADDATKYYNDALNAINQKSNNATDKADQEANQKNLTYLKGWIADGDTLYSKEKANMAKALDLTKNPDFINFCKTHGGCDINGKKIPAEQNADKYTTKITNSNKGTTMTFIPKVIPKTGTPSVTYKITAKGVNKTMQVMTPTEWIKGMPNWLVVVGIIAIGYLVIKR
jgi:hypothetical protein